MKADFSRIRFNPRKQYTAVLEQQGRVSLDADANEQAAIHEYLGRNETVDVIGAFGAPEHDPGFAVTVSGNEILIGAGRYYVQGLVCENLNANLLYLNQPHLLNPVPTDATLLSELIQSGTAGAIRVFLQVWQRVVTALDDPCLREPALGQADTTTRLQTVWRVVAGYVPPTSTIGIGTIGIGTIGVIGRLPGNLGLTQVGLPINPAAVDCCVSMYSQTPTVSTGSMSATTFSSGSDCSCQPVPAAGYQGLENQLYRVEIHTGGTEATATFKWSRENGSVVSAVTSVSGTTLVLDSLGPDANLGFQVNQWVEVSDDTDLFGETPNEPGMLYQISGVDPTVLSVTLYSPVIGIDATRNARIRRWDQTGPSANGAGVPLAVGSQNILENGIQISFRAGTYQAGDYWTIPARTATGTLDWPPCGGNGDTFQPPHSVTVYNAPLACIHWDPKQQQAVVEDCRRIFAPLTELSAPSASKAMHVTAMSWQNDGLITADVWVANGLSLTLDNTPTSPITSAEFIVTIESVFNPFPSDQYRFNPTAPATLLRTLFAIDSTITVSGTTVSWTMPYLNAAQLQMLTVDAIDAGLLFGISINQYARVRVRLLGSTISSGTGTNQLFLDGACLGQPTALATTGKTRVDLQLPSGAGERASNFDSWFYLAPTLLIANISVGYPALYIELNGNNAITGVSATPTNPTTGAAAPLVSPFVILNTNYPALYDTQLTLSLQDGKGGISPYAKVISPVTIRAGESSVNAAIGILANPTVAGPNGTTGTTVTITVAASIATALGPIAAAPVTFTLTGMAPRIIIG